MSIADEHVIAHILADTRLAQKLEQLQLSQSTETEHGMVKGGDLLDRDLPTTRTMHC